jgi:hypothetical protein
MPKRGSQPANKLVIRFAIPMLIFASHRLRNRISSIPVVAMAMILMPAARIGRYSWVLLKPRVLSFRFFQEQRFPDSDYPTLAS